MLASGYGDVVNDEDAAIHLQGAGVYGVSASRGTALNAGDIYLDGFIPTLDDEGNITSTSYWHPSSLYLTSAGMVAGSTDGDGDATATNTGTINVNNAGFGMMALNGGVAINQGTINLTADEGVTKTDDNQLVGMAALNGGTVINDTTGTINIDASYGKPFLADNNSSVINYGTVCFDSNCQSSDQYNPTDSNVSWLLLMAMSLPPQVKRLLAKPLSPVRSQRRPYTSPTQASSAAARSPSEITVMSPTSPPAASAASASTKAASIPTREQRLPFP